MSGRRGHLLRMPLLPALAALAALLCGAAAQPAADQEEAAAEIRRVGPDLYQIGAVTLDAAQGTVRLEGRVNMETGGPVELLACLPRGKTHESVFVVDLEPKHLQIALLLLGLKDGRNPAADYPEESLERLRPPGDEVAIFVEWRPPPPEGEDGQAADTAVERRRGEEFLYNLDTEGPSEEAAWVFLGSRVVEGWFGADAEGSLISTYYEPGTIPLAILELVHPTVNDDTVYKVNEDVCPPQGTPVELIIQPPALPSDDGGAAEAGPAASRADDPETENEEE